MMLQQATNETITIMYKTGETGEIYFNMCVKEKQPHVICCYRATSLGDFPSGCFNLEEIKWIKNENGEKLRFE